MINNNRLNRPSFNYDRNSSSSEEERNNRNNRNNIDRNQVLEQLASRQTKKAVAEAIFGGIKTAYECFNDFNRQNEKNDNN